MVTALLAIGPHRFETTSLNYQEFVRSTEAKWVSIPRFGRAPGKQFVGFGDDTITMSGLLFPEEFGDREAFEAIRATQREARPVPLIGWADTATMAAKLFGNVVILFVDDTQSKINASGQGRKISYTIDLALANGDGKPVGLFI